MKVLEPIYKVIGYKKKEVEVCCGGCLSTEMVFCASDEDPDEILGDMVQCLACGRKTDLYEAKKQAKEGR